MVDDGVEEIWGGGGVEVTLRTFERVVIFSGGED